MVQTVRVGRSCVTGDHEGIKYMCIKVVKFFRDFSVKVYELTKAKLSFSVFGSSSTAFIISVVWLEIWKKNSKFLKFTFTKASLWSALVFTTM